MFYAHSKNSRRKKHNVREDLLRKAELARSFAPAKELDDMLYSAGLLHDRGRGCRMPT
jgi:hypothetical protein